MKNFLKLIALAALLAGCNTGSDLTNPPGGGGEMTYPDHWTPTNPTDHGPGSLDPVIASEGKIARRVSVDQLRNSIPALFGGITWTVPVGRQQQPGFTALSRTLGEADYVQANTNNLDASPLFAKFMDDMAGDVCTKAIARDRMNADTASRLVMREADVDANLRFLRLKLHGLLVAPGSTDGITDLRELYDAVLAETSNVEDGWYAVCVAMLTAPEFMAY